MAGMDPRVPMPPLMIVPATQCGCQGAPQLGPNGEPGVVIQLANSIITCQFPADLDQARKFRDDIDRAIIEAQHAARGLVVAGADEMPAPEPVR